MFSRILALVLAMGCFACAQKPRSPAPRKPLRALGPLHGVMHAHFVYLDDLQKAVIAGDLHQAKLSAQWIMDNRIEPAPVSWAPFLTQLETATATVTGASNLSRASLGAAQIAGVCGACHEAHKIKPPLAPPTGTLPRSSMQQHKWAINRAWDAVVSNSDIAWREATRAFSQAPLLPKTTIISEAERAHVQTFAQAIRELGRRAGALQDRPRRVQALSALLATCAACHTRLGIDPEAL